MASRRLQGRRSRPENRRRDSRSQAPNRAAPAAQPGTDVASVALPQPDGKVTQVAVKPTSIYIQAGAFLRQSNANQLGGQLRKYGPVRVTPIKVERQNYYRVRIGPIASVTEADKTLKRMIADGHPEFAHCAWTDVARLLDAQVDLAEFPRRMPRF